MSDAEFNTADYISQNAFGDIFQTPPPQPTQETQPQGAEQGYRPPPPRFRHAPERGYSPSPFQDPIPRYRRRR